jgi:hypothetical protein
MTTPLLGQFFKGIFYHPSGPGSRGLRGNGQKGGDVARRLHLNRVIENGVIGHSLYHIAQIRKRSDLWDKPGAIPQAEVKRICNESGLGIWGFICTLYGTEEQIAVNLKIAQEAFKQTGGQMLIEGMPEIANTPFVHWIGPTRIPGQSSRGLPVRRSGNRRLKRALTQGHYRPGKSGITI